MSTAKKLDDICELIVDCEHKTAPTQEEGYPSIRTPNIGRGRFLLEGVNRLSEETYLAWTKRAVPQENDLILAREAPVGNVAIITKGLKVCLGQRTVLIRPNKSKVDPHYLVYLLLGDEVQGKFHSQSGGATVAHLNMKDIRNLDLPVLPTLETQCTIASILSAYDDLIENNTRRIKILEEMARMIYSEWFVNFRFPGHEKVKMVDSPIGKIPKGWEVVELQKVCDRITDGSHTSPETRSEGYPMASVKDMYEYGIAIQGCRKISEEDYVDLVRNDCKVKKDDVLIAKDGSYLKHCFVVENDLDVVLLSSIAMLRPNSHISPHLLAMILKDPEVKERMRGYVSGVAIPRIVLKDFRAFQIVLPPKGFQDTWGGLVEPLIKLIWRINSKNQNLRQTRDLLLPKLISGEVAV